MNEELVHTEGDLAPNEGIFWAVYYGDGTHILAVFRSPTTATAFADLVGASTDLVRVRGMGKLVEEPLTLEQKASAERDWMDFRGEVADGKWGDGTVHTMGRHRHTLN